MILYYSRKLNYVWTKLSVFFILAIHGKAFFKKPEALLGDWESFGTRRT